MLEMLRKRREDDEGFTLIELMVVVLIIAILIAIAIPTFLGARQRAQDRAAQSNVRNAFTAEKTFYTDGQAYTATVSDMTAIEPSLTYTTNAGSLAASGNLVFLNVSTVTTTNDTVILGAQSGSGKCFWLKDNTATGTKYATTSATPCANPGAGAITGSSW
jgi:type IV pilus assembly protein PilA